MTDPYRDQNQTHRQEPWNQPPTTGAPVPGAPAPVPGEAVPGEAVPGPPAPMPAPPVPQDDDQGGRVQQTKDQAKDSARHVAEDAKQAGGAIADTAKAEARGVKDDAVREGRKLFDEASSTLSTQASDQMGRAAGTVRSFTDDLGRMSRGEEPEDGLASDLVKQVSDRSGALADWMENHEPADVLTEVQSFARRRPVTFLAIAAGIGFAAGRLTRSMAQVHSSDDDQDGGQDAWTSRTGAGEGTAGFYGPGDAQYRATPVPPQHGHPAGGTVPPPPGYGTPGQQGVPGQGVPGQGIPGEQGVPGQGYPYDAPVPPAEPTRPVPPRLPESDGRGDIR